MFKFTYSEKQMENALIELGNMEEGSKEWNEFADRIESFMKTFNLSSINDKKEKNKAIADYNGITVSELIASPNYSKLKEEWQKDILVKLYEEMKEFPGFDDVKAQAVIYMLINS